MKSILIIGMSTFGQHLLIEFSKKDCDVMIVDRDEAVITPMIDYAVSAKIADCTIPGVLRTLGVDEFDRCFVCLGGNLADALEITYQLKELGAKRVISEVNRSLEKKFMLNNGADAVVYPEEDIAKRVAGMESSDNVFDTINLSDGYNLYEIKVPNSWIGKSIIDLKIRSNYNVNIIGRKKDGHLSPVISPNSIFTSDEHIMIICHESEIKKLAK